MPIHDQGYRRYVGSRAALGKTWQVITWAGIRTVLAKRSFIALMLMAWAPFVVRAVQVYVAATFQQASFLAPKAETFREFLLQQGVFVFFVTIYIGAGLIANDRRANALQVYLSKPLTRAEYVGGKFAILFSFLVGVTWLPAILLLIIQSHVCRELDVRPREHLPAAGDHALFAAAGAGVGDDHAGVVVDVEEQPLRRHHVCRADLLHGSALSGAARDHRAQLVGVAVANRHAGADCRAISSAPTPPYDLSAIVAVITVIVLIAGSAWILERRVRGVEVVQ